MGEHKLIKTEPKIEQAYYDSEGWGTPIELISKPTKFPFVIVDGSRFKFGHSERVIDNMVALSRQKGLRQAFYDKEGKSFPEPTKFPAGYFDEKGCILFDSLDHFFSVLQENDVLK